MYTLMMMTALSTSPDAAQFNGYFRDLFNRDEKGSCTGKDATSNTNAEKSSCQGSCHGQGLFHGKIISMFQRDSNSCQGSSCQGNNAAKAASSCQGSSCRGSGNGCCGGGAGYAAASCIGSSCFGGMQMAAIPYAPMGGEYYQPYPIGYGNAMDSGAGCFGNGMQMPSYPSYPSIPSTNVPMVPSGPPMVMPPEQAQPRAIPPENATFKLNEGNRATVIVKLPADAKLYAEGRPLNLSSGERKFTTPPLPSDREAVYNFRIEYSRDGELVTQSKKLTVKAGGVSYLEFNDFTAKHTLKQPELHAGSAPKLGSPVVPVSNPLTIPLPPLTSPTILPPLGAGSAQQVLTTRAKITVKVPSGAVLFVDGKKNDRSDAIREFSTPALTSGKVYTYVMRIERGAEKEERKIEFMAGEAHSVDFTAWPASQQRAGR